MKHGPRIRDVLRRAQRMNLDLEQISFRNLTLFYAEELQGLHEGTFSLASFPLKVCKKMLRLGILLRPTHNKTLVSPESLELIITECKEKMVV